MLRLWTQVTASPTALLAELVGELGDRDDLGAAGPEQGDDLVEADLLAEAHAVEDLVDRRAGLRGGAAGHERHRLDVRAAVPLGAAVADEHDLGTVLHDVGGGDLLRPDRARVVAAEALGVAAVHHGEAQGRVEPALRVDGRTRGRS